jgi:CspA family cold shock protein
MDSAKRPTLFSSASSKAKWGETDRCLCRLFIQKERRSMANVIKGTVKWFNDSKGYGFIVQDGGGEDVFIHHSAIQMEGFRTLAEGQKVEFELTKGPKGYQAQNVRAG